MVVSLGTHLHGLSEGRGTGRKDHELLESQGVSGVGSTVDDVEGGGREDIRRLNTSQLSEVLVKGNAL